MIGLGLGLGLGQGALQPPAPPADWRTLAAWGHYADQNTIVTGVGANINTWNDGSGNAHAWTSPVGPPQKGTLNGKSVVVFTGSENLTQAAATSTFFTNGASGTGYILLVLRMAAIGAVGANPGVSPGPFGFSGNYGGMTIESTNGPGAYVYDGAYEQAVGVAGEIDTVNTKVIEFWWDHTAVNVRTNGGTTHTHAATNGPGSLAGGMKLGKNITNGVAASMHAIAFLGALPGNAAAIVAAMMTEYGAA